MRVFIFILWLILGIIYWWIWDSGVESCCDNGSAKTTEITPVKKEPKVTKIINKSMLPLAFGWGAEKTILGDGFKVYKDSILNTLKNGEILEITGLYRKSETNTTKFTNLGIARAKKIRLLFPDIPDNRVRLFGKIVGEKDGEKSNNFVSALFRSAVNNENIKEFEDLALIYFPFNSTNKLDNSKIEKYLDEVAVRVKKTGKIVYLIGHTDSIGSDESNIVLGKRRAIVVRDYLISKGVSTQKIKVESKGESSPIARNDTSDGRAKNRRVELKIK